MLFRTHRQARKGQAMVEYALLLTCVVVVGAVAVSMLGHKTADNIGIAAAILPGAHTDDNNPISTEQSVPTQVVNGVIMLNTTALTNSDRFANILDTGTGTGGGTLVSAP